ncbi:ABC transporter ATP-binding protein [Actinomadura sp. 9N407]|uniref:ABC transporter ATP-binding protein n=1 Tax=Actinomadura sp. 9N407 TaxID=3375154 RepID=UPI00378EF0BC
MLEINQLVVRYGRAVLALRGVTMQVADASVACVLGANGAGKSTLMRAISGTLPAHRGSIDAGSITWRGRSIVGRDPADTVKSGIVQVPEGRRIFRRLTVEENLRAGGIGAADRATRTRARSRVDELFPVLAERRHQAAGLLSGGEQQMLAIGRALMAGPSLLLLDEPSLGLAPKMVARIGEVIREVHQQGTAVMLVEQNASMALAVSDTAYVLEVGAVSLTGAAAELASSDAIQRIYLGHAGTDASAGPVQAPGDRTALDGGRS